MPFSNNWFERDAQAKFEKYLSDLNVDSYLEVGVCEGRSFLWVYENLRPSFMCGIDHWKARRRTDQEAFDIYRKNFESNTEVIRQDSDCELVILHTDSVKGLAHLVLGDAGEDHSFDLIYCDGTHFGLPTLIDMCMAYSLLNVGGMLVVDDLNRWFGREPQTRIAVHAFEQVSHTRMERSWLDGRQCGFVKKK